MKTSHHFKSLLLLISASFLGASVFGQSISIEQAKSVARNFYYQQNAEITSKANLQITSTKEEKWDNETLFYLCQVNEQGFVIVANDLRVPAVLGYSTESGDINHPNPEFAAYLNRYKRELAYIKAHNIANENPEVAEEWQSLSDTNFERNTSANKTTSSVSPLLTCNWGQGNPYNNSTPGNSMGHAVTGCVATAMAQIMHYHKHPSMGNGSQTESNSFGTYTVNYENAVYDFANMPNTIASGSTNTEIPKLMYHAGISVDMDYGLSSSSASSSDVPDALATRFGYNNNGMIDESDYSYADWKDYLKSKLDNNLPLYFRGSGPDGGHAWVCDGYNASNYFHMNWGWSGSSNGYFSVGNLNPSSYTFDDGNEVIVNTPVKPDLQVVFNNNSASSVNEGAVLTMSLNVLNMGFWKARSSNVKFYFSTDNIWSANDTYLAAANIGALNEVPYGNANLYANVSLSGYTSGYVIAKCDANNQVNESNENNNTAAKYITINYLHPTASSLTFYGNFNSVQANVAASSAVNWTATSNQTWCGTNFNTGTGNGNFFLNIAANPTSANRYATVTITGNGMTKTIAVTQKAKPAITLNTTSVNKHHGTSSQSVSVTSTVPYSITDNAAWITLNATSGLDGNTSFSFSLSPNTSTASRIGTITVSGYGISKTVTVTQQGFNNEPCYARQLSVYSSALYVNTTATNENATTTAAIPPSACAGMSKDVWFKFTVPSSGSFTIQTSSLGSIILYNPYHLTDVIMSAYIATSCSTTTLIDCVDNYNGNEMPKILKSGYTPGAVIYVRVGVKTNIEGDFNIVVFNSVVPVVSPNNEIEPELSANRMGEDTENIVKSTEMQVFPNPASSNCTLKMNYAASEEVNISIVDITGKVCYTSTQSMAEGDNSLELDLTNWASGLYFVSAKGATSFATAKIHKQ